MNYNKALEIRVLQFLRANIGQDFTPADLWKAVSVLCASTEEEFKTVLRILMREELISVSSYLYDDENLYDITIKGITKEGLQLLRTKKY